MPSSDECYEAAQKVREWYYERLKSSYPHWPKHAIDRAFQLTSYDVMRNTYVAETGAYTGPYSPLG
jgi:hypothetical protein